MGRSPLVMHAMLSVRQSLFCKEKVVITNSQVSINTHRADILMMKNPIPNQPCSCFTRNTQVTLHRKATTALPKLTSVSELFPKPSWFPCWIVSFCHWCDPFVHSFQVSYGTLVSWRGSQPHKVQWCCKCYLDWHIYETRFSYHIICGSHLWLNSFLPSF